MDHCPRGEQRVEVEFFAMAREKKSRKAFRRTRSPKNVERVPVENPLARDEGPRLIPFGPEKPAPPFQNHLDLADILLKGKKKA